MSRKRHNVGECTQLAIRKITTNNKSKLKGNILRSYLIVMGNNQVTLIPRMLSCYFFASSNQIRTTYNASKFSCFCSVPQQDKQKTGLRL